MQGIFTTRREEFWAKIRDMYVGSAYTETVRGYVRFCKILSD